MAKKDIFSKVSLTDYNNVLEGILEKKDFSEEVKNLLLSMLYKVEDAYKDYENVKVNVKPKKEFIKNIIEIVNTKCNQIILNKPPVENRFELDKENGIIKTNQNELALLEAILKMQDIDEINEEDKIYNKALEYFLEIGEVSNGIEVISDFDGWSWNIQDKKENTYYHLIYQNLLMLLESEYIRLCDKKEQEDEEYVPNNVILHSKYIKNDKEEYSDFFKELRERLIENNSKELVDEFIKQFKKVILILISKIDENEKNEILKEKKEVEVKLEKMNDKKTFIEDVTKNKIRLNEEIIKIEDLLNNEKLLKEDYEKVNEKLPNKEKIFSVSQYAKQLIKKKSDNNEEIKRLNKLINPKEFVKIKSDLEEKSDFYKPWESNENLNELEEITKLQNIFLKCIKAKIENEEEKEKLKIFIYEIRYYKVLALKIDGLKDNLNELEKILIKKSCKAKLMTTFSEDEELNFNILKNIFDSKIAELENIITVLYYDKELSSIEMEIHDGDIVDEVKTIKITKKSELIVKLKKKIKIF